jgi:hypothetical protein
MSSAKAASIFRVEYELMKDMSAWTAFIMAFSHEEALSALQRKVGPHHVMASGFQCRVDAMSDEVRYYVTERTVGKPKKEKVDVKKTEEVEEKQEVGTQEKKSSLKRK